MHIIIWCPYLLISGTKFCKILLAIRIATSLYASTLARNLGALNVSLLQIIRMIVAKNVVDCDMLGSEDEVVVEFEAHY